MLDSSKHADFLRGKRARAARSQETPIALTAEAMQRWLRQSVPYIVAICVGVLAALLIAGGALLTAHS